MDTVSAVASAIAIYQIADRVIDLCRAYIKGVRDAPSDLRAIIIEVGGLKSVLEVIELLDESHGAEDNIKILEKLQCPLEECREALKGLEALISFQTASRAQGKRQKIAISLANLAWPSKKDRALKILQEIGRYKSTISLGLTTEAAQDLKDIRRNVEKIRESTNESEKNQILEWLVKIDPSTNHNSACELHEEHTGQWLTNSPEYSNWKAGSLPFLWLHGIPGAGKTVLHSYIAEDVKIFCQNNESKCLALAYYYCYFGHSKDETPCFLRWVINQLCRQIGGIPSEVQAIFKAGGEPKTAELLSVLHSVAEKNFSRVYITIDALDEAPDRQALLKALCEVVRGNSDNNYNHIQLLATSRKERSIEDVLKPIAKDLSLTNPYVDEDIRTFIKGRLQEEPKFRRWPNELRCEIEQALVEGAKGMFRWAFCQLDILKRHNTASEIRFALTQLPETLDETYESILCSIPPEHRNMVYRTLNLLAAKRHLSRLTLEELSDVLAVNLETHSFDPEDTLFDLYAPVEACMCLLTYDADKNDLKFAHYTVKEFLMSARISSGPARSFHMTNDSIHFLVASCFIVYMLCRDYENSNELSKLRKDALLSWWYTASWIESRPFKVALSPLITQLLDPTQPHYRDWRLQTIDKLSGGSRLDLMDRVSGPSAILINLCVFGQFEIAQAFFESQTAVTINLDVFLPWVAHPNVSLLREEKESSHVEWSCETRLTEVIAGLETGGEILSVSQAAIFQKNTSFLELFLGQGADVNALSPTGFCLLTTAVSQRAMCMPSDPDNDWDKSSKFVDLLLTHKAHPNITECVLMPLQSLVGSLQPRDFIKEEGLEIIFGIVRKLLDAGAKVNGTGYDATNIKRIHWTAHFYLQELDPMVRPEDEYRITSLALHSRGHSVFYDTPLRILEWLKNEWILRRDDYPGVRLRLTDMPIQYLIEKLEDLLKSYGGKSLHLFPVADLPGYCQEDMEQWNVLNGHQDTTPSLHSQLEKSSDTPGPRIPELETLFGENAHTANKLLDPAVRVG